MTALVWETAKKLTLKIEGGFQNDPRDKGNWTGGDVGKGELKGTKYGISAAAYPNEDIKNLTLERAEYLYKRDYWHKCKCDYLPDCLSIAVFDYAINSGVPQAIKDLQRCLYVTVDGIIGNQTIGAANRIPVRKVLENYINRRREFVIELSEKPKYRQYRNGWVFRVGEIRDFCEKLI